MFATSERNPLRANDGGEGNDHNGEKLQPEADT